MHLALDRSILVWSRPKSNCINPITVDNLLSCFTVLFPQENGSQCRQENPDRFSSESRILEIQRAESAKMAALTEHAERLCALQEAQNTSTRQRLGLSLQDVILPPPELPASPRRRTDVSARGWRTSPLLKMEVSRNQRSWEEEDDDSFWEKVLSGGRMAALACKEASTIDGDESPTASISSVDTHTPSELRRVPLIVSPVEDPATPPPPRAVPLTRRRVSRLPVFSAKYAGKGEFL